MVGLKEGLLWLSGAAYCCEDIWRESGSELGEVLIGVLDNGKG
jgi:hypothetical protein